MESNGQRTWLLIRGLAHEQAHWGDFKSLLQEAFPDDRVIGMDLPGVGVHYQKVAPVSLTDTLIHLRNDALSQAKPPYMILSISFGSMITLEWSKKFTDEIEGMVLMNTSLGCYSPFYHRLRIQMWKQYMQRLVASDPFEIEKIILEIISNRTDGLEEIARKRAEIHKKRPVTMKNIIRQLVAAATYQSDGKAPVVPTLLLAGKGDNLCDPKCSEAMAENWGLPLYIHPWAGHDLTLDASEWVINHIINWINKGYKLCK